ncbi:hypothetical protein [Roseateles sp. MS654]|uniref:hypothetical protein n=1 Tax=Roseateles sp. MS654 TaxID=3412685 RepID=UPI003C2AB0F9
MGRKSDALAMTLMDDVDQAGADTPGAAADDVNIYADESQGAPVEYGEEFDFSDPPPAFEDDAMVAEGNAMLEREAQSNRVQNDSIDVQVARSKPRQACPNGAAEAARLSTVRDYHQQISPDDALYFVMCFIERAGQQIASSLADQVRFEGDEVLNRIRDSGAETVAAIKAAVAEMQGTQTAFKTEATNLGIRLRKTADLVDGQLKTSGNIVLRKLEEDRNIVVPLLKQQLVDDLTGDDGELEAVKRQVRTEIPDEVRLAIKAATAAEVSALKAAMAEAALALANSAKATRARARNGWLKNVADDVKALVDENRYFSVGVIGVGVLFAGYLLTRIVTGIF